MSISSQFCLVLDIPIMIIPLVLSYELKSCIPHPSNSHSATIPTGPAMCAASLPDQRPPAARGEGLGNGRPNKIGTEP